jgi:hypothetical protein
MSKAIAISICWPGRCRCEVIKMGGDGRDIIGELVIVARDVLQIIVRASKWMAPDRGMRKNAVRT